MGLRPVTAVFLLLAASASHAGEEPFRPKPDRNGILELPAARARLLGERLRLRAEPGVVTGWTDAADRVRWEFVAPKSGPYIVVIEYSAPRGRGGSRFEARVGDEAREGFVHETGDAAEFLPQPLRDAVRLEAGKTTLELRALEVPHGLVMNVKRVRLVPDARGGR